MLITPPAIATAWSMQKDILFVSLLNFTVRAFEGVSEK